MPGALHPACKRRTHDADPRSQLRVALRPAWAVPGGGPLGSGPAARAASPASYRAGVWEPRQDRGRGGGSDSASRGTRLSLRFWRGHVDSGWRRRGESQRPRRRAWGQEEPRLLMSMAVGLCSASPLPLCRWVRGCWKEWGLLLALVGTRTLGWSRWAHIGRRPPEAAGTSPLCPVEMVMLQRAHSLGGRWLGSHLRPGADSASSRPRAARTGAHLALLPVFRARCELN